MEGSIIDASRAAESGRPESAESMACDFCAHTCGLVRVRWMSCQLLVSPQTSTSTSTSTNAALHRICID